MTKKSYMLLGLALLLAAGIGLGSLYARQRALSSKMIRFHVVANSDSEADQSNKLAVRDALLCELEPLSRQAGSRAEMQQLLAQALPSLRACAEQTLRSLNANHAVEVTLQNEPFPTRYYDTFALPAGSYLSLRVRLGAARGHNWWCVCFPSLCRSACTGELETVAAGAGFSDDEIEWMTQSEKYTIRFQLLEWLEALTG